MTTKQKTKLLEDLDRVLTKDGWNLDKYGNYILESNGKKYRMKIQSTSVRYEVQCVHSDNSKSWVRLRGAYIKDLSITEEGKIKGLKRG